MPFFLFNWYFLVHTFSQSSIIHTRDSYVEIRRSSSSLISSVNKPLSGAKPRIDLGPALQQADALPSELCRTNLLHAFQEMPQLMLFALMLIAFWIAN